MTIWVDPANKNLIEALTDVYVMKFPEVKFKFVYEPENIILQNLINSKATAAFINKPLSDQQTKYIYQQTTIEPRSTLLAYDAVIFIAGKESSIESVSIDDLKNSLLANDNRFVFDDGNSGNFNTVTNILKIEIQQGQKVRALENSQQVIEFVTQSTGTVGIIGMNVISEKDNPEVKEILSKIKVLPIKDSANVLREPTVENILEFNYPFFKGVYFIVSEPGFGIGSGFSRFAGSQQGQLIVGREGLQPNFLYDRQVKINNNPL
ncbi:phosphate transport system substrate-binding protein [Moheibacter sediminis]|uniref:Phosphate transport system substrate-binding protein n=2 Tax=Moheibacter sediminis TaxID=1434700 RepID=A0A1W1Z4B7_9FLAO|nr:phosphate transport system substrate-binding protein [Moheibacter sediminis]